MQKKLANVASFSRKVEFLLWVGVGALSIVSKALLQFPQEH